MAQNDRSGLQTALEAAHKIGAAARIAKAAMLAGLKGAAVAAVKETAPFLLKLAIGLLIAVVLVPMSWAPITASSGPRWPDAAGRAGANCRTSNTTNRKGDYHASP